MEGTMLVGTSGVSPFPSHVRYYNGYQAAFATARHHAADAKARQGSHCPRPCAVRTWGLRALEVRAVAYV